MYGSYCGSLRQTAEHSMDANGAHPLAQTKLGDGYILLYGYVLCDRILVKRYLVL